MNNIDFAKKAKNVLERDTLYVKGCFGAPLNAANQQRYINANPYNQTIARKAMIRNATPQTFGFDCVCLVKALLWGWDGDTTASYGGAKYASNGVPDVNADTMITLCKSVQTDFGGILIGEFVWMPGHCGIYVGDGLVVECTPKWDNGVQLTTLDKGLSGVYNYRKWEKHGLLPWVVYDSAETGLMEIPPKEWEEVAQFRIDDWNYQVRRCRDE